LCTTRREATLATEPGRLPGRGFPGWPELPTGMLSWGVPVVSPICSGSDVSPSREQVSDRLGTAAANVEVSLICSSRVPKSCTDHRGPEDLFDEVAAQHPRPTFWHPHDPGQKSRPIACNPHGARGAIEASGCSSTDREATSEPNSGTSRAGSPAVLARTSGGMLRRGVAVVSRSSGAHRSQGAATARRQTGTAVAIVRLFSALLLMWFPVMCRSSRPEDLAGELAAQHPRSTFWHPHSVDGIAAAAVWLASPAAGFVTGR
jgi:hypothetical protein